MLAKSYKTILFFLLMMNSLLHQQVFALEKGEDESRGVLIQRNISNDSPQTGQQKIQQIRERVETGEFHVLLIAIDDYQEEQQKKESPNQKVYWGNLDTAIRGAEEIKQVLINKYGIKPKNIITAYDVDRNEILKAINQLRMAVKQGDSVLIFYGGHGILNKDTGEGYWVPVGARGFDEGPMLNNVVIRDKIKVIAGKAKHTVLISDSCFSGNLFKSRSNVGAMERSMQHFVQASKYKSVQLLTAGGEEDVDDGYKDGLSPFTWYLKHTLANYSGPFLDFSHLAMEVKVNTSSNSNQTPEQGPLSSAGHANGEFILVSRDYVPTKFEPVLETALVSNNNRTSQPSRISSSNFIVKPDVSIGQFKLSPRLAKPTLRMTKSLNLQDYLISAILENGHFSYTDNFSKGPIDSDGYLVNAEIKNIVSQTRYKKIPYIEQYDQFQRVGLALKMTVFSPDAKIIINKEFSGEAKNEGSVKEKKGHIQPSEQLVIKAMEMASEKAIKHLNQIIN